MPIDSKEREEFERAYRTEEREILVLMSDGSDGAGKDGGKEGGLWTASKNFLAYVDVGTNELFQGEGQLVWPLTVEDEEAHGTTFPYFFKDGGLYRIAGRELRDKTVAEGMRPSFYNQFLVARVLEENIRNDALLAILEEYRKPVVISDAALGEFTLNKNLEFFEGRVTWLGDSVNAYLEVTIDRKATWTKALDALRTLFEQQAQKDAEFRAFAAKKLVALANEWQEDEEEAKITKKEFAARIALSELSVTSGGAYTAYYDDDEMFAGHVVTVSGSLRAGVKSANIEG